MAASCPVLGETRRNIDRLAQLAQDTDRRIDRLAEQIRNTDQSIDRLAEHTEKSIDRLSAQVRQLTGYTQERDEDLEYRLECTIIASLRDAGYVNVESLPRHRSVYRRDGNMQSEWDAIVTARFSTPSGEYTRSVFVLECKQAQDMVKVRSAIERYEEAVRLGRSTDDISGIESINLGSALRNWRDLISAADELYLVVGGPNMTEDLRDFALRRGLCVVYPTGTDYRMDRPRRADDAPEVDE